MTEVAGGYISFPFCAQKCTYCNFASGVFPRALEGRYLNALRSEIGGHEWSWRPETLYIGGGTPSNLEPEQLSALLQLIPGRPWYEVTIEAAPGGITREKAEGWRACGINRVSLGVQSFVTRELMRTGRKHSAEVVALEIDVLRQAGISNINIDLIAGLSGQTESSWQDSLEWVERLAPEHVSVYMLEIDEDSRLGKEILLGGVRYGASDTLSEERTADLYEMAVERLDRMGIRRYEISNFARPGSESRHNLKYWRLEPYIGFGADAHSFDGRWRSKNAESAEEYVERFERGEVIRSEPVLANRVEERFFVGLRLSEGVRLQADEWERYSVPIRRFLIEGLLEQHEDLLRLSDRGVLLSNEVFQEFLI